MRKKLILAHTFQLFKKNPTTFYKLVLLICETLIYTCEASRLAAHASFESIFNSSPIDLAGLNL